MVAEIEGFGANVKARAFCFLPVAALGLVFFAIAKKRIDSVRRMRDIGH